MPTEWKTKNLKVKDLLQVDGSLSISGSTTSAGALNVSGATKVNNTLSVLNTVVMSDKLSVAGAATLNNNLNVGGTTIINGTLSVGGGTFLGQTTQQTVIREDLHVNDSLSIAGSADIVGDLTVSGATVLSGPLTLSDALNLNGSVFVNNTGLNIKDSDNTHNMVIQAGSNLTDNRTLKLSTGDADREISVGGDLITTGNNVTIEDEWSLGRMTAASKNGDILKAAANPRFMQGYAIGR